jgi:DNA-binding MarR family transcriptional regulator
MDLDVLLHQPLRTQIAAFLAGAGSATFSELKHQLDVSDGNLESHLKKLIAGDYVMVRKESGEGRRQTHYDLTPIGREALQNYIKTLQKVLVFDASTTPAQSLNPSPAINTVVKST